jgi:type IV pilus assembly protein PilW
LDALTCAGTASTSPDSIAISYEADAYDTIKTSGGAATDCLGSALTSYTATAIAAGGADATFTVADNRFYIASAGTVPSLYCRGIATSVAQPLVENVEDLQLRYGAVVPSATPATTDTIAGYRAAVEIEPTSTPAATAKTNWGRILTVRICVVVRSENPVVADANSGRYYKCDGTLDTSQTDLRLRRAYSTTVVLRNRKT